MSENTALYVLIERLAKERNIKQDKLAQCIGKSTRNYRRKADTGFTVEEINKLLDLFDLKLAVCWAQDSMNLYEYVRI